ncbi:hypothetical protein [Burkholderia stagnalis]|uniref:hypothetical protein n=1 Tax=Burkholderia stagnalis TaxID=1503054 RepID=UPI00075C7472|nr:hypothetical protein [Burkholderia stagnalis]KVL84176.1 hypothetical protein WT03_02440 [Burkholderia stagnalis]KVL98400.1 hypothetical protein WT02_10210 [Burkholderia stagnalis]KVM16691.1 hypothetical protein WT04_03190 [Burkholderia stagnalis]
MEAATAAASALNEADMARVRYIGDPNGDEHRRGTHFAGIAMPIGEWVDLDDAPARKLLANRHFEVDGVEPAAPVSAGPEAGAAPRPDSDLIAALAALAALDAEHRDLLEAYVARGAELNEAQARVAELEAALANAATAAQGDADGGDADGPGKPGAEEDQGARDGANGRRRGSAAR